MKKKIFYSTLIIFAISIIFGATISMAANLSQTEAQELLNQIPNEIALNIKETQFSQSNELIYEKLGEILGEDVAYDCGIHIGDTADKVDIRKAYITIYLDEEYEEYVEKDIKIIYTNSQNYNETDKLYVEEKTKGVNFNRRWDYEIYEDGTHSEYQDKSDFSWNSLIDADDIFISEIVRYAWGDEFIYVEDYALFFFKNEVLYKVADGSKQDTGKIIVPEETAETDEAYINYAKPIIEKLSNYNEEWEEDGTTYYYIQSVKNIERENEDFIQFKIEHEYEAYIDNELSEMGGFTSTVLIAKANEYRCKLVPVLQGVEIINKDNKEYVKGTMKITETEIGYETSIDENYPPKITLIDNNGNRKEAVVTASGNDIYYFEIELDKLSVGESYVIEAAATSPYNKYPSNNINTTIAKNTNIDVSNSTVSIKSTTENNCVKLNIEEMNKDVKLGDISGDGKINARDAKLALQSFVGEVTLTEEQKLAADVNQDGRVNARDAKLILQYYTGAISEF